MTALPFETPFGPALSGDSTLGYAFQRVSKVRSLACAMALTVSAIALSGCTTSKGGADALLKVDPAKTETAEAAAPQDTAPGAYRDQQVAAVAGQANPSVLPASAYSTPASDSQPASLTMQPTGVNAMSNSIFSSQRPVAVAPQAGNGMVSAQPAPLPIQEETGVRPASNSLFNSAQPQSAPATLPLEGAANTQTPAAEQVASNRDDAAPAAVPLPSSGDELRTADATTTPAADQAATSPVAVASANSPASSGSDDEDAAAKPMTLAALFAAKRKNKNQFNGDRFAKAGGRRSDSSEGKPTEVAALGFTDLPGVQRRSMYSFDDSEPSHDDEAGVQVASLSGLARLAPSGLLLQTEKVETGCFKPDLLRLLKIVETHYGQKVMVTSGLRDLKHNASAGGRKHSLHTTCDAADIQIEGVGKWELADYLRTLPGRGGVGTYCHTESVHIDTGEARDWNWRCRRRRG